MNEHNLSITIKLYNELESKLMRFSNTANYIDNSIIVISVLTSGGLWLLAGEVLPKFTTWIGAALSTAVTGLTLYTHSAGFSKKRQKAITLHSELSMFLARVRSDQQMSEVEFWDSYKSLEHRTRTLSFEKE